jgi:hypothetical protein
MKQSDKSKPEFYNDKLRAFFTAEEIEKPPAELTARIMELVSREPVPVAKKQFSLAAVPIIYCTLLAALMLIALFVPNTDTEAVNPPSWLHDLGKYIPEIPEIRFDIFSNIVIPEILTYIVVACFGLFIFDLFLKRYFNIN